MTIKFYNRYKLLKADVPEIVRKKIVKDVNVGGIKLQYEVSTIEALVFMFFGKQKIINLTPRAVKTVKTFLRPYKVNWGSSKDKFLPKSLWGATDDPLTNNWVELELDYKDLSSGIPLFKDEIRNTNITKHLFKIKPLFYVELKQSK